MELPPMDMPAATTVDRRLIENPDIPAGPPGAEADHEDFVHRPGPPPHPELQDQQQQHHHQQQQLAATESPAHTSKSSTRDRDPRVKSRRSSRSPSPSSSSRHRRRGGGSSNRRSTSSSPDRRRGRSDRGRGGGGYDDRSRGGQRRRSRSRDRIRSPLPVRRTRRSRDRSLSPIRHGGGGIGGGRYQHRSPDRNDRYRGGGRRSRSRSLSPRRSASRRGGGGGGWSPMAGSGKKGPVSPPPLLPTPSDRAAMLQQQQQQSAMQASQQQQQQSYQPMPMYHGGLPPDAGYNQYGPPPGGMAYGQADAYGVGGGGYADYGMQQGPPPGPPPGFNAYAPPQVMQPVVQQVDWNRPPEVHVAPVVMQPHPQQLQQQQQQHPPTPPPPVRTAEEEKQKRDAAIEQEKKNQRATLRKQRDDYKRRSTALKHELNLLRDQHDDLETFAEPPSPTTKGFLKENHRLQMQIENKIATIENVIDMLSGMIGPDKSPSPSPPPPPPPVVAVDKKAKRMDEDEADDDDDDDDSSPERLKTKALQSLKRNKSEKVEASSMAEPSAPGTYEVKPPEQQVNFVHYDPEMHWCQTCQVFPKTAKDFLTHLHSKDHQEMQKTIESPWHDHPLNDEMPNYPNAPTKRTPIRGLQFFVPTTGWYCRICDVWMGDLHCASLHLKSKTHARQYHDYAAQNPSFEVDWMSDRQRAYEQKREEAAEAAAAAAAAAAANVQPPPPPSLSEHALIGGGIPLQIPVSSHKPQSAPTVDAVTTAVGIAASVVMAAADDAAKKRAAKKRKKEERREKKKKKRSRKHRKHRSSSSSSNSDSSNSDNDCNDTSSTVGGGSRSAATPTADASATSHSDGRQTHSTGMEQPHDSAGAGSSHSIRVAMRNLLQQQSELQQLQEQRAALQTPPTSTAGATAVDSSATAGRWTVVQTPTAIATSAMTTVPPPPTISANGAEANRKDELMIAQWNEPQAVISEKEKQLLEELKGRLKKRSPERPAKVVPAVQTGPPTVAEKKRGAASPDAGRGGGGDRRRAAHSRSRSRERSSGGYHRGRGGRSRSRGRRVSRSRSRGRRVSRSRSRGRRISRSRSRSRSGGRYAGSNVRSTRRTRSRSRTRTSRVEKPIVRYPEFRPRVPETDKDTSAGKKQRSDGDSAADRRSDKDKKVAMVLKKGGSGASGGSGAQVKKLPFIGRMPVFKKQTNDEEQRRDEEQQQQTAAKAQAEQQQQQLQQQHQQQQQLHHHHQHPYMHHPQQPHHMYHPHHHHYDSMHQMAAEDYDNLMPDPMQFVSMMGAPPPPPMVPPPPPPPVQQQQQHIDTEPVLPPGIDAADADQVIKPISDAPLPRKGPLPQDFQDALSIIFPGERRPDEVGDGAPGAATAPAVDAEAGVDAMTTTVGNSLSADASDGSSDAVHQHLSMLEPSPEAIISAPPISAAEAQETAVAQAQAAAAEAAALRDEQKSQHSIDLYSAFSVVNGVAVLNTELAGIVVGGGGGEVAHMGAFAATDDATAIGCGEVPLPPPSNGVAMLGGDGFDAENGAGTDSNSRDEELKAARLEELNDMAMLGIDADDLAAQCM